MKKVFLCVLLLIMCAMLCFSCRNTVTAGSGAGGSSADYSADDSARENAADTDADAATDGQSDPGDQSDPGGQSDPSGQSDPGDQNDFGDLGGSATSDTNPEPAGTQGGKSRVEKPSMADRLPQVKSAIADDVLSSCIHYEEDGFFKADAYSSPYDIGGGRFLTATSPHFMPAMDYTARIMKTLALEDDYYTIFVIAPNHSGLGLPVTVTDIGWDTPFGVLDTDTDALFAILADERLKKEAGIDRKRLEEDHSASTQMPFVKYYLPNAKVVSLLVSKAASTEALNAIAEGIYEEAKRKRVFLLCSIDFSHYEDIDKTPVYDGETETLVRAEDVYRLKSLGNSHMDSPETMYVFMSYASMYADRKQEILDHRIFPESLMNRATGYSYYVYAYIQP